MQSFKPGHHTHIAYDLGNLDVLLKLANTFVPSITFSDLTDEDMGKSGRVYSLTLKSLN